MSAPKLDLSQFASLDDALAKINPGDRYRKLRDVLPSAGDLELTPTFLFWLSMITRSQGLHLAIAREAQERNPVAVFPLIRAFAEAVTLVIYVIDHPKYIEAVSHRPELRPKGAPRRRSMQALISYAAKEAPGMKHVYSELSEATHFGAIAMWASHSIEQESESVARFTWVSEPRWTSDKQALIACAQTLELSEAMIIYLRRYARRHLLAPAPESETNR